MVTRNGANGTNVVNCLVVGTGSAYTSLATANSAVLVTDGSGVPSISTTLPSAVQLNITSLGTVTTGTWSASTIAIAYGGANATSYTASNGIITYNGTSLVNYSGPKIDSSGRWTNTTQPAFLATVTSASNVTGDGTDYTVTWTTEIYDQGNNFDAVSTYTAPVTGIVFSAFAYAYTSLTAGAGRCPTTLDHTPGVTFGNGLEYTLNAGGLRTPSNVMIIPAFYTGQASASDLLTVTANVNSTTKTIGVGTPGFWCITQLD